MAAVSLNIEVFFQQKELEKAKKQAKEAALLQQCKNSIGKSKKQDTLKMLLTQYQYGTQMFMASYFWRGAMFHIRIWT